MSETVTVEWGHRYRSIPFNGEWSRVIPARDREAAERDVADYFTAYGERSDGKAQAELVSRSVTVTEWLPVVK